jgi:osmotically-inducible protein OsmY
MRIALVLVMVTLAPALGGCIAAAVVGGGAAAAMVGADPRSVGAYTDDETIGWKTALAISDKFGDKVHINVTSYNRIVLLTGEAPTEEISKEIQRIAQGVANVREVRNEITIGKPTSFQSWTDDSYITTKVKSNMLGVKGFNPINVKVVTENGVVYLMGLVTRKQGDVAGQVASTTSGVKKVVKIFEYVD